MANEKQPAKLEDSLVRLTKKLDESVRARPGEVDLHLTGEGGGEYSIKIGGGKTSLAKPVQRGADRKLLLEVWGDAEVVRSIIDGEKNAVKQFLDGGLRIRGNLRHFSDVAVELGLLKKPL